MLRDGLGTSSNNCGFMLTMPLSATRIDGYKIVYY